MRWYGLVAGLLLLTMNGCQESAPSASVDEPSANAHWQQNDSGRWVVPLQGTRSDARLRQAIATGRQMAMGTLAQAQSEWNTLPASTQQRWAIIWAAPTYEKSQETEELLWVIPVSWTPHRVEATLATSPTMRKDLSLGSLVAFPSEEVADWADFSATPRRGAAILEQMELLIGAPPKEDS